jgi:hypothetical protein
MLAHRRRPRFITNVATFSAAAPDTLALDMDFATNGSFLDSVSSSSSLVTFTRASTGTYFNSSGVLSSAAIDAARFDYNPSTLAARGLLVEGQATNLMLRSGAMDNAIWEGFNNGAGTDARTANSGTAPDGTNTATLCAIDRALAGEWAQAFRQLFTGTAATYAGSVWLKAYAGGDVGKVIALGMGDGANIQGVVNITLTADWVRYSTTGLMTASASCDFVGGYFDTGSYPTATSSTDAVNFLAWGAQVELGSYATSYIPTVAATVTRSADIATMTGTNFSDWYDAATGTFVVDFDVPSIAAGTRGVISADNNTADERIELYNSTADPKTIIVDGGATQADLDGGTLVANTAAKLGLSYAANDAAACLNGGAVQTDATITLPTPDRLRIGVNQAGNYLNGRIKSIKFYNEAKSDANLQTLTT